MADPTSGPDPAPDPSERAGGRPSTGRPRPGGNPDGAPAGGGTSPPDRDVSRATSRGRRSAPQEPSATTSPSVPLTQQIGRVTILILAVLFGIFAVANSQPVDFSWIFGETLVEQDAGGDGTTGGVPLIVLLLGTFVLGGALGALSEWYFLRSRRRAPEAG